jgi:hypothetical protein
VRKGVKSKRNREQDFLNSKERHILHMGVGGGKGDYRDLQQLKYYAII